MVSSRKHILFDMDGVITSETGYWRATLCTILDFAAHLGHRGACAAVFGTDPDDLPWTKNPDPLVHAQAQNASINTNWDHCHIMVVALLLQLGEYDPANIDRLRRIDWQSDAPCEPMHWPPGFDLNAADLTADALLKAGSARGFDLMDGLTMMLGPARELAVRKGAIWQWLFRHFQCWFVGTNAAVASGLVSPVLALRRGIIQDEQLVVDPGMLACVFERLKTAGWTLGVATGRPRDELVPTMERFGLLGYFDPEAITTNDEIVRAEKQLVAAGMENRLSKPHPFPFLRSLFPAAPAEKLAAPDFLPLEQKIVVVGDTVGDMSAARVIGAVPVGVLTGPAGEGARDVLIRAGAAYILRDVSELPELLHGLPST